MRAAAMCVASAAIYYVAVRFVVDGPFHYDTMTSFAVSGAGAALLTGLAVVVLAPRAVPGKARSADARRGRRRRHRVRPQVFDRRVDAARSSRVAVAGLPRAAFQLPRHADIIWRDLATSLARVKCPLAARPPSTNNDDFQGDPAMRGTIIMWSGDKGVVTAGSQRYDFDISHWQGRSRPPRT